MPRTTVITRARTAYTAELRSHSRIASPWKPVSASQFARSACHDPKESGLSWTSCASVFVAASSSQMTGRTKKTRKASSSNPASTWPGARDARRARWRGRARGETIRLPAAGDWMSARIKESRSGDEHGGHHQGDHEELDGDRRGVVDIVVLEREVVGQLVG